MGEVYLELDHQLFLGAINHARTAGYTQSHERNTDSFGVA